MSTGAESINLTLYVDPGNHADDEELDLAARRLRSEIRDLHVESVELLREGNAPEGSKSAEALTAGALAMAILPVAIPPLLDLLKAWTSRGESRTVRIKTQVKDKIVELEYSGRMSPEELNTLKNLLMA